MSEQEENEDKNQSTPPDSDKIDFGKNEEDILKEVLQYEDEDTSSTKENTQSASNGFNGAFKYCSYCGNELINRDCLHCTESTEEDYPEEEYEKSEEEQDTHWREELRKKGELSLFGIFCVVVASIYIIYISLPEVLLGFTGEFTFEHFVFYLILLIVGLGALFGGFVMARHVIIYGRLFDTTFEKEIYSRLEPAFAEVGKIRGDLQEVYDRMDRMNLYLRKMEKGTFGINNVGSPTGAGRNHTLYVSMMILSLGVFFYLLSYPGGYLPYVLSALFLVWWAGITSDFKLWKINIAWTWAFFAVIVVSVSSMLMHVVYGTGFTIGILGIALCMYSLSYYIWARYYVEGISPDILPFLGEEE